MVEDLAEHVRLDRRDHRHPSAAARAEQDVESHTRGSLSRSPRCATVADPRARQPSSGFVHSLTPPMRMPARISGSSSIPGSPRRWRPRHRNTCLRPRLRPSLHPSDRKFAGLLRRRRYLARAMVYVVVESGLVQNEVTASISFSGKHPSASRGPGAHPATASPGPDTDRSDPPLPVGGRIQSSGALHRPCRSSGGKYLRTSSSTVEPLLIRSLPMPPSPLPAARSGSPAGHRVVGV